MKKKTMPNATGGERSGYFLGNEEFCRMSNSLPSPQGHSSEGADSSVIEQNTPLAVADWLTLICH